MEHKWKVSVIIPAYNAEKYIRCCLDSIIQQKFDDVEIIVINDGSTDNTGDICQQYSKNNSNIVYISQTNKGVSATRNKGIACSNGEIIVFLDADDQLSMDSLHLIYNKMTNDNLEVLTYNASVCFENGKKCKTLFQKHFREDEVISGYEYLKKYGFNISIVVWMWAFRREFLIKNKLMFVEGRLCEDTEWTARWFPYAEKIGYVNKELYCQMLSSGSIMRSVNLKRSIDLMYISKLIYMHAVELKNTEYAAISEIFIQYASEEAFASIHSACTMGFGIQELENDNEELFDEVIKLIFCNKKYYMIAVLLKFKCWRLVKKIINIYDKIRGIR